MATDYLECPVCHNGARRTPCPACTPGPMNRADELLGGIKLGPVEYVVPAGVPIKTYNMTRGGIILLANGIAIIIFLLVMLLVRSFNG